MHKWTLVVLLGFSTAGCSGEDGPYLFADQSSPEIHGADSHGDGLDAGTDSWWSDLPGFDDVVLAGPGSAPRVKILSPSSHPTLAVASGSVDGALLPVLSLAGVVGGAFDSLWVRVGGTETQIPVAAASSADSATYFAAPPVSLPALPRPVEAGTFEATSVQVDVVARGTFGEAVDRVTVAVNPGFEFPDGLRVRPDALFVNEYSDVVFSLDLNRVGTFQADSVAILQADASCAENLAGTARLMRDDGVRQDSGDELARDRIYTARVRLRFSQPGAQMFRVALKADVQGQTLVAYTPCVPLFVVQRYGQAECETHQAVLAAATSLYDDLLADGMDPLEVRRQLVAWLMARPSVERAGGSVATPLVWVQFASGILGAVQPAGPDSGDPPVPREFSSPGSVSPNPRRPSARMVLAADQETEERLTDFVRDDACPPWRMWAAPSRLAGLRNLQESGVLVLSSGGTGFVDLAASAPPVHWERTLAGLDGDPWGHGMDVAWTDASFECSQLQKQTLNCFVRLDGACCVNCSTSPPVLCPEDAPCLITHAAESGVPQGFLHDETQIDLALGRLVLGPGTLGMTSPFVSRYAGHRWGPDLIWLGFATEGKLGGMAMEFLGAGADSVILPVEEVSAPQSSADAAAFLSTLAGLGGTPASTLASLGSEGPGPWRLAGGGNLNVSDAGLVNSTFSAGILKGWKRTGDARVLASWCGLDAPAGTMALVSTGIGYTVQTGEMHQEFCLEPNVTRFQGSYLFLSHEFKDSCGTQYQDQLQVFLEDSTGQQVFLATPEDGSGNRIDINMLCDCSDGFCGDCDPCGSPACRCGQLFDRDRGWDLVPWDPVCAVDADDAWHTGWRPLVREGIPRIGGERGQVKLVVRVSDRGDAQGATTVLLGEPRFQ